MAWQVPLRSEHRGHRVLFSGGTTIITSARFATILLVAAATISLSACAPTAASEPSSSASAEDPTPSATPTPSPEALAAIDEGLITSDTLCVALAATDLDLLSPVGITAASTLSTDQAGDNGRCYFSDAPDGVSVVLDFGPDLSGTEEWLSPTWPGPCIGESRSEIVTLGGYETALSYCTEYTIESAGSARHFTAVATTPGGGVDCRHSTDGDAPGIDPEVMIEWCAQAFERLNGTAA